MNIYDFEIEDIKGNKISLEKYANQVILIVNTASKCGFTPQLKGLEILYKKYHDQGFTILGFPCNQFAKQDPGSNSEIESFCQINYGVTFPMFAKIDVNGEHESPLYHYLKSSKKGFFSSNIKWNFTKFLINRNGEVVARFAPMTTPKLIGKQLKNYL